MKGKLPADIGGLMLSLAVTGEVIGQVYYRRAFDLTGISIAYFLFGLAIAILPMMPTKGDLKFLDRKMPVWLLALCWIPLAIWVLVIAGQIFEQTPLDYRLADMIPIMQIMGERFLEGQDPYAIIPEIWGGMQPIYLPAMWMAYLPATLLGLDPRWVGAFALLASLAMIMLARQPKYVSWSSLIPLFPMFMLVEGLLYEETIILSLTEEMVVVAFYLILGMGLLRKNLLLSSLGLALCMLSRYALALWAVMYAVYALIYLDRKKTLKMLGIAGGIALALMLISGAMGYLDIFLGLQGNYLEAVREHRFKFEPVVNESLGLAKLVSYEGLGGLHRVFLLCAVVVPVLSLLAFNRFKDNLNAYFFPLCSLKLALVFFFNLLIIPYIYLFYTSTFLSVLIMHAYLSPRNHPKPQKPLRGEA